MATNQDEPPQSIGGSIRSRVLRPLPLFGRDVLLNTIEKSLSRKGSVVSIIGMAGVGKTHLMQESAWRFSQVHHLPVQFGGEPEQVVDGLYVIDRQSDRESLIDLVSHAMQLGWRVLAESHCRLESDRSEDVLASLLPTPTPLDPADIICANPAVQLLLSQVVQHGVAQRSPSDALCLAEIACRLDGLPSALKAFSYRLMVETPEQIIQRMEVSLAEFVETPDLEGESISSLLAKAMGGLSSPSLEALIALSLLDGASADLAFAISATPDSSEVWRELEKRSLISVLNSGVDRRFQVPKPIAFAVRRLIDPVVLLEAERRTWRILADWSYKHSREQKGPNQDLLFTLVASELENLKRGLRWGLEHDPSLAAYLVVATWRTVCSRGHPSLDGDLLFQAASAGAHHLSPLLGGESWMGAAITLSMTGQLDLAEPSYLEAIRIYEADGNAASLGWAQVNYSVCVLAYSDIQRAIDTLKAVADNTDDSDLRTLARTDYALVLASTGVIAEPIRVAEDVFATRLQSKDHTMHARAYVDLGELYQVAGRAEAARPLIIEGIRRLRDAGVQYMLLDQLIYLGQLMIADEIPDWIALEDLIEEADAIAVRMGAKRKQLKVSRIKMTHASRCRDRGTFLTAIEETLRLTQSSEIAQERGRSLRQLAVELKYHGKDEYSAAILGALGEEKNEQYHPGWMALLSSDSHATVCVLAVVMAKEALQT